MRTPELASSLRNIVSVLTKKLRKTVEGAIESFSMSDLATLSYLYSNDGLSISELASLVLIKAQSMSEILAKLEGLGMIARTPSATDKRKSLISLTAKGKKYVEQTRSTRDEWLAKAIDDSLTAEEKRVLSDAVRILHKVMEYK